jgi:D-threo-aldose 1-dehydrogenase
VPKEKARGEGLLSRRVSRTDVYVTEIGFGTAPIGNLYRETPEHIARAALDAAWEAGIRYFDTAPHYGLGLAEQRLGRALARRSRAEYVLSTKVGRLLVPNSRPAGCDLAEGMFAVPDALTEVFDFSADGVRRSLDDSLRRLGVDRIDIALVHDPDDHVEQAINEAIPALLALREEGVVGAVGVAMNQWQAPLQMVRQTDLDVVMLAGRWTLADRSGATLLEACADAGVSVLAAAPYNSGLLAVDRPGDDATFDYGPVPAEVLARVGAMADLAAAYGARLPELALQFPLRHLATAAVVAGLRSPAEVHAAIRRIRASVPPQLWSAIELETPADV